MAWDAINLHTDDGVPVSKTDRETILNVAEQVILGSEHDPKYVIRAAQRISRKLHLIESLRGYAKRAMTAADDRAAREQKQKDKPVRQREMDELPDLSHRDDIENQILVRELLESLPPLDREIVLRKVSGETGPDIDRDMNLKPRTSETRFRAAKNALRQLFAKTPDINKRSRAR
jgi:DNA-directed RNA polymerase specialized sigma24 family protein